MKVILDNEIKEFLNYCNDNDIDLYLVGGAVRDLLINKETFDYDFCLISDYNYSLNILNDKYKCKYNDKYQSIKLKISKYDIEITHARGESNYIDYRHPNNIEFISDISIDSKRRDFTINALYYKDGNIYDFYSGIKDLKKRNLRVIGDTLTRFKEDPLRLLRMIRFASEGFNISNIDHDIIKENIWLVKKLSLLSFNKEFDRILDLANINVINQYKEVFEVYFDTKFDDLNQLRLLENLEMKKTYLNINNSSCYFKYKDLNFTNDIKDITKKIYKYGKNNILKVLKYYDLLHNSDLSSIANKVISEDFYDKKQLDITSEEIVNLINKKELTSYYIDKISYSIIDGKIKNNKKEIINYILEIRK